MTVACENGRHHVVNTMLKELHTLEHLGVYMEVLRRNGAKVCTYTIPVLVHVILHRGDQFAPTHSMTKAYI